MVGLDVTMKTQMSTDYLEDLKRAGNPHTDFIYAITKHYMSWYTSLGIMEMPVHDSSAIAYVIDPSLFTTKKTFVDVEYHSPFHEGQTVADWQGKREREPNVDVCVDVDSKRFLEMYRRRLTSSEF
jgi:purine nucleosidase